MLFRSSKPELKGGDSIVDSNLVGEGWPAVQPGPDPVLYGHVQLTPKGAFEARSLQTFTLVYTVGRFGLDDTGAIRVVFRAMGDAGRLQISDPAEPNYVTAQASNGATLSVEYSRRGADRKSTRLNPVTGESRMPSSA